MIKTPYVLRELSSYLQMILDLQRDHNFKLFNNTDFITWAGIASAKQLEDPSTLGYEPGLQGLVTQADLYAFTNFDPEAAWGPIRDLEDLENRVDVLLVHSSIFTC